MYTNVVIELQHFSAPKSVGMVLITDFLLQGLFFGFVLFSDLQFFLENEAKLCISTQNLVKLLSACFSVPLSAGRHS